MGGPWLYAITGKKSVDAWFNVPGKPEIPTTFENYKRLVENEHLGDDPAWNIWKNGKYVETGDEVFIYTGDKNRGIIGYATVDKVSDDYKILHLNFAFDLCRWLSDSLPVPAQKVRSWKVDSIKKLNLRQNLINLGLVERQLRLALPQGFGASPARESGDGKINERDFEELLHAELPTGNVLTGVAKALASVRLGQQKVRKRSMQIYGGCCAVCDISDPKLLIASHVVRWADSPKDRGNPSNVICLCRIHDAMFDAGYWSLDDNLKVLREKRGGSITINQLLRSMLKFREPIEFSPEPRFLKQHRKRHGFNSKH